MAGPSTVDVGGRSYVLKGGKYVPQSGDGPTYTPSELEAAGYIDEGAGDAPKTVTSGGTAYQYNPETDRYDIPVGTQDGGGGIRNLGNGVFQDESGFFVQSGGAGGAKRYITEAEARNITDPQSGQPSATELGNLSARWAELGLRGQQLEEEIRQANLLDAREKQNLGFLFDKLRVEEEAGKRQDALRTRELAEQIQGRIETNDIRRQGLFQDYQNTLVEIDRLNQATALNAAQSNQAAQSDAARINDQRRAQNQESLLNVTSQIGEASTRPGDIGRQAAILASGGLSGLNTASADTDFRSDESLGVLEFLLRNKEELDKGPELFNPTLIDPSQFMIDKSQFKPPTFMGQMVSGQSGGIVDESQVQQPSGWQQVNGRWVGPQVDFDAARTAVRPDGSVDTGEDATKFAEGGTGFFSQPTQITVGEAGPEVVNVNKARGFLDSAQGIAENRLSGVPKSLGFDRSGRDNFAALSPSSISAPGTPQFLQEAIAAYLALTKGIDPTLTMQSAQFLRPAGMREGVIGRAG